LLCIYCLSPSFNACAAIWSANEAAGSFQCGLKEEPTLHKLSDHLKKQGFHIVYASQNKDGSVPSSSSSTDLLSLASASTATPHSPTRAAYTKIDIEIGICNVRTSEADVWFLARFIVSMGSFSAVMKCSTPDQVPTYVKKFLLAKVLKLDTGKQQKPAK
jgi:hypothetical protein